MFKKRPSLAPDLEDRLQFLADAVSEFPLAFVHGDFWPFHVGSRQGSEDMLAIDLGWSLLASRFFDIALFVGPSDDVPPFWLSRNDITDCYIQEYRRLSGEAVARADFLVEVDAAWMAWNTRRLPRVIKPALDGDAKTRGTLEFLMDGALSWKRGEPLQ